MNFYGLLLPQASILVGIFIIMSLEIWQEGDSRGDQWLVGCFVLGLSLIQQALMYRAPYTLYARGGLVHDGTSQIFSLAILALSLLIQLSRMDRRHDISSQNTVLFLLLTLFAVFAVRSNRFFFGIIALVGLVWATQGVFTSEAPRKNQPSAAYSGVLRGLVLFVVGTFFVFICTVQFGDTQMDEIQKFIVRSKTPAAVVFFIQTFILFLGMFVASIPPFTGIFGQVRKTASWPLALGLGGIFSIVGINIFLKWALWMFSRPGIGALELEPLTSNSVFLFLRVVSIAGLLLVPIFALAHSHIRQSFMFFALNPMVQAMFALSFGQREVMGFAVGQVLQSVFIIGLLIAGVKMAGISENFEWKDWVGVGRHDWMGALILITALMAAAGLSPFYGSYLIQKTLCINSWSGMFLIVNVALSGYLVARLTAFAFQRSLNPDRKGPMITFSKKERLWFLGQSIALIFMGILWQPLYNYGAFSIRNFFGEL